MMSVFQAIDRAARLAMFAVALVLVSPIAHAQPQKPSTTAIATAKQIVTVTGSTTIFNPLINGVVEQAKIVFLQQNPGLAKDLNDVAADLRKKLAPRFAELTNEVTQQYASRFTEQELKDVLAFYQTPAGKKLIAEQPKIADTSLKFAQDWANKLSEEVIDMMRAEMKKKGHDL